MTPRPPCNMRGRKKTRCRWSDSQHGGKPIVLAGAPDSLLRRLNHYTGSICLHPDTGPAAVSFWDSATARFLTTLPIRDAGGISLSADGESFVVTNGLGEIHTIRSDTLTAAAKPSRITDTKWDNHMTLLAAS